MNVLVTGAAGFIGYHLSAKLINDGFTVIGFDNLNNYYDVNLKKARLEKLKKIKDKENSFVFKKGDLINKDYLNSIFYEYKPSFVINLAAQAGVRYSIENPKAYIESNIVGFSNILECCREYLTEHLLYASSSSVYGGNSNLPLREEDNVDHPVSLYGATKKSNELMAHSYSHLYNIPTTGLRFFTVYGPWGRPDMALFLFTKAILNKEPINIFNNGNMIRDFTYIDDVVESVSRLLEKKPTRDSKFELSNPKPHQSWAPYKIFNIGNSSPINLMDYIINIEEILEIKAIKNFMPMQDGDVKSTESDTKELEEYIGYKPNTTIKEGISRFISWYKSFYNV
ncbi:NAD-dependent epimerase [Prochlorococcus marinus]|uniref:NAD-dependent epimerase n=1 Tax=Prochlorococcus marinus TaxID=1219 RepID=UPI001AD9F585|nr:NAD-dependent epimerase [Prochlorococcus marinus]MBO8219541.1 NAD-dependent epimerase [Prochlorococcus marinus CUG1416]MBW3051912.1 capsular biosynthesis protein CpsI [Prochlorococcus marinus str. MU1416]